MSKETIKIPDVGSDQVEVIEICVAVGDEVAAEDSLVVLESDKASMEVPSPKAGKVTAIHVSNGQSVGEGDDMIELEVEGDAKQDEKAEKEPAETEDKKSKDKEDKEDKKGKEGKEEEKDEKEGKEKGENRDESEEAETSQTDAAQESRSEEVAVPDIGTDEAVDVIEVCVAEGDEVAEGDGLIVLESDKASMEVPAPFAGRVESLTIKVGDTARQGDVILTMAVSGGSTAKKDADDAASKAKKSADKAEDSSPKQKQAADKSEEKSDSKEQAEPERKPAPVAEQARAAPGSEVYAGPAVRKIAREFSIDLKAVTGSGPKGRIVKEDLQGYVKGLVENKAGDAAAGSGIPRVPEVDFSAFGEITTEPASKLHKLTAANMHRSWLNVPHVTQFDDADITELEAFRKSLKAEAEKQGVKMTPMPFLLKACAAALKANPKLNASLADNGETIVYKQYVHIGIAVDTPAGLMVPVVRDVDQKSLWELAAETAELAAKAKDRKLKPQEMQGGCFTISSLGSIGGQGFTPIVNTPEVAILGVSKLAVKPVWNGSEFEPREMLPLSLSYDHRAINGADAGRFMTFLVEALADIRRLLL